MSVRYSKAVGQFPRSSTTRSGRVGHRTNCDKTWDCKFCRKKFRRTDVLRRHYKTCPGRGLAPIPSPLKKGKRRRACDRCVASKLSCDSEQPCESCLSRGISCTYARLSEGSQMGFPQDLGSVSNSSIGNPNQDAVPGVAHTYPQPAKSSISFLLNYANPETRSLTDTFGYSTASDPEHTETLTVSPMLYSPELAAASFPDNSMVLPYGEFPSIFQSSSFDLYNDPDSLLQTTSLDELLPGYFFPIYEADPIESQYLFSPPMDHQGWYGDAPIDFSGSENGHANDLISDLTEFCHSVLADHPECAPSMNLERVLPLLTPSNVQQFVDIYFHHWHRHSPIIHRGTFDARRVSLPLLLIVILTGALFSSSQDEVKMARDSLDLAEEYAFRNPCFLSLISGIIPDEPLGQSTSFEAIQAAFSVAQVQLREGSLMKKKYTRTARFDDIIFASRTISLITVVNSFFHGSAVFSDEFDWSGFSQTEAKIRLMCGVFNLDASFTIFYDMAPRISAMELAIDMPCSIATYRARNATDCHDAALSELSSRPPQLNMLLATFLGVEWGLESRNSIEGLNILHLFVIILALLQIMWMSRHNASQNTIEAIRRALVRWKERWDAHTSALTPQQLEDAGFTKDAAIEFWHLANIITRKGQRGIKETFERRSLRAPEGTTKVIELLQSLELEQHHS